MGPSEILIPSTVLVARARARDSGTGAMPASIECTSYGEAFGSTRSVTPLRNPTARDRILIRTFRFRSSSETGGP
jgi:hypothetical protein